jgi:hypothetical protein
MLLDQKDARVVGHGSEFVCGIRGMVIVDEIVAYWPRRAVAWREEDNASVLLHVLFPSTKWYVASGWAALVVVGPTTWAAAAAEIHQVNFLSFSLFSIFCFYFLF